MVYLNDLANILTGINMERVVRQTRINPALIKKLKIEAAVRGIYLQDLYEEALLYFLEKRSFLENGDLFYLTSPRDEKELNVKIRPSVFAKIEGVAEEDKVSLRRLIYTALFNYVNMLETSKHD